MNREAKFNAILFEETNIGPPSLEAQKMLAVVAGVGREFDYLLCGGESPEKKRKKKKTSSAPKTDVDKMITVLLSRMRKKGRVNYFLQRIKDIEIHGKFAGVAFTDLVVEPGFLSSREHEQTLSDTLSIRLQRLKMEPQSRRVARLLRSIIEELKTEVVAEYEAMMRTQDEFLFG